METERDAYSVEPGRNIYRNGEPLIVIRRDSGTYPSEADDLTHVICALLN